MTPASRRLFVGLATVAVAAAVTLTALPNNSQQHITADTTVVSVWSGAMNLPPQLTHATATSTAMRGPTIQVSEPPPAPTTTALTFADACAEMSWYRAQAGLPERFDKIGWRESRCIADPTVRTTCCVGQSQLWVALHLRDHRLAPLYAACGITSEYDVDGPQPEELQRHWCAAAAVYNTVGYSAWATA